MIAATPTGTRNVKSCLLGISDGTVCPYSRRPSPRKKSHVSTISCTSPSASGYGLPISRVTSRASASLLASTSRPTCAITRPRAGAGTAAHSFWAARAARAASTNVDASPSATSATTSSVRGGVRGGQRAAGSVRARLAADNEATVIAPAAPEAGSEAMEDMGQHGSCQSEPHRVAQRRLEPVDRPDVDRIGAAQHGGVDRDQVAQEHQ